ncbi:hypothetical protein TNCV_2295951 [Trichonephila clavipes]|nr:hypothetical protein TNCV_2295951 [Trichonephila clavipes]
MAHGEEDKIQNSITYIKNLTWLTSAKYNELNAMLSEWTKTEPLKKSSMPNQLPHGEKAGQNLRWLDGLVNDLLVLKTKKWKTLAGRRLAWKRLLEKAETHPGQSSH